MTIGAPHRLSRPEAGFTLMELMVSLAVVGMISLIATGALLGGNRMWTRADARVTSADRMDGVRRILNEQISTLLPIREQTNEFQEHLAIRGEAQRLVFVAPLPAYFGSLGLYRIEYRQDGDRLVFARSLYQSSGDLDTSRDGTIEEILLVGVEAISFTYLGNEPGRRAWFDSLDGLEQPPELVGIEIRMKPETGETWSPLYVQPRITSVN